MLCSFKIHFFINFKITSQDKEREYEKIQRQAKKCKPYNINNYFQKSQYMLM